MQKVQADVAQPKQNAHARGFEIQGGASEAIQLVFPRLDTITRPGTKLRS